MKNATLVLVIVSISSPVLRQLARGPLRLISATGGKVCDGMMARALT